MLEITEFKPVGSINSLLRLWGLAVSNKDQIIQKLVLASVAALTISSVLPITEGIYRNNRVASFDGSSVWRQLGIAVSSCKRNCVSSVWSIYRNCIHSCNSYYGG